MFRAPPQKKIVASRDGLLTEDIFKFTFYLSKKGNNVNKIYFFYIKNKYRSLNIKTKCSYAKFKK